MAQEFRLPDIGEGLTEAEVVRWLVPVGREVAVDQPVVELETDKAVVEIPSPYAGVVLHHGAPEGAVLAVGSVLVVVGKPGESWPPLATAEGPAVKPIVGSISEAAEVLPSRLGAPARSQVIRRVQALPVVRKLAKELSVDLAKVTGSGPEGRVTRDDVMAAASAIAPDGIAEPAQPAVLLEVGDAAASSVSVGDREERTKLSRLRRTIAANMARSWRNIPHVTTFDAVDGSRLLAVRRSLETRHQTKVPLEALVVKAVLPALVAFPEFNATLDGEDLIVKRHYDIGVAVDTADGLLVAVVKDADRLAPLALASEISRLAEGAKERRLGAGELTGQTFTISNIGALGGGYGTPIVPPSTTAILSVGRAREEAVVREGRIEIAPMIPLSLSYDHRVIDGGAGRRFMTLVLDNLAEPALFLAT